MKSKEPAEASGTEALAREGYGALARAKLDVLAARSSELLELDAATCKEPTDRAVIKEHFKRSGVEAASERICSLIRCGAWSQSLDLWVVSQMLRCC